MLFDFVLEQRGGGEMLAQLGINLSWGAERGSQMQYFGHKSFPAMLLVLSWEGQATSWGVSEQRESLGRQSEWFGWTENSDSHLDRSLVLINGVNIA